jgi:hypothetical protein
MKNKLDNKAKRGAIVKSLAFGSRKPHIPECFKAVASFILDRIFEIAEDNKNYEDGVKQLLKYCFEQANSQDLSTILKPT